MRPEQEQLIERLFLEYFDKLTIYARSVLKNLPQAEELVQDTFHEAVTHIDKLMDHENPGGWLMQALKYKIRAYERARAQYLRYFFSLSEAAAAAAAAPRVVERAALAGEEPDPLEKIRGALTPEEFRFLKRLVIDKAGHRAVAGEFGITLWASQKRLERIRAKLNEIFPEWRKKK